MKCSDVTFEMGDGSYESNLGWWEGGVGSLVWNPKGGDGHVIVAEVKCGEPSGRGKWPDLGADCGCNGYVLTCTAMSYICECGEDNAWRDHHYRLLRKSNVPKP